MQALELIAHQIAHEESIVTKFDLVQLVPPCECLDYSCVKITIFKTYELVPKAYHHKFRNYHKLESQTQVGFACEREKCILTEGITLEKLAQTLKSFDKSF